MTAPARSAPEPAISAPENPAPRRPDPMHRPALISPLRYPGAKRQMIPFFADLIRAQPEPVQTFVEPFAGGASISLHLAASGLVDRAVIGEADDLVHSFWKIACKRTGWLIDAMHDVEVSLAEWDRRKANPGTTEKDKALSALFLNRTSFSGILYWRAGPIGGRSQAGPNPIGCRFNKGRIAARLTSIGELADEERLLVAKRGDYTRTIDWATTTFGSTRSTLMYLDPPFWAKADTLYRKSFDNPDHLRLAEHLVEAQYTWLLSYDAHPEVIALYKSAFITLPPPTRKRSSTGVLEPRPGVTPAPYRPKQTPRYHLIDFRYNAHSSRRGTEELVVTNLPVAPDGYLRGTRTSDDAHRSPQGSD